MRMIGNVDPLEAHREGVKTRSQASFGEWEPGPLVATAMDVTFRRGFATIETSRTFTNAEAISVEVTMTFPVPIEAVLHELTIEIDGRKLRAGAEARMQARATYEAAIDAGKLTVLHEEVLRGVHMISIGQLGPGASCAVISTWSTIATLAPTGAWRLRIPTTVGEIYGRLPLNPADDFLAGTKPIKASLVVRTETGVSNVPGHLLHADGSILTGDVELGRAIDIVVTGAGNGPIEGCSDSGRVSLEIDTEPFGGLALDLAILFDRSGSTSEHVGIDGEATVWSVMRDALSAMLRAFRASDTVTLYEFETTPSLVGRARGAEASSLVDRLEGPAGGTEISSAIDMALNDGAKDILVLTDGRSGALDVHRLAKAGARISALLVGPDSLEAMIGHLAALTGGRLACHSGMDAIDGLSRLAGTLQTVRPPKRETNAEGLPARIEVVHGVAKVTATWSGASAGRLDAVGAFAAAMALPAMSRVAATKCAIAHGLCTHLTSLVIVDEAGAIQGSIPETRKIPLPASTSTYASPARAVPRAYPPAMPAPTAPMVSASPAPPATRSHPVQAPVAAPDVPSTFSFDAPASLQREGTAETSRNRDGMPEAPAPRRPFIPARRPEVDSNDEPDLSFKIAELKKAGTNIDWSRQADRLMNGDLNGLDPFSRHAISSVAEGPQVTACAAAVITTEDPVARLALAIAIAAALTAIVSAAEDRSAARLIRRVRAQIGDGNLRRLAAVFSLSATIG